MINKIFFFTVLIFQFVFSNLQAGEVQVDIEGVSAQALMDNINAYIDGGWPSCDATESAMRHFAQSNLENIESSLRVFGYYEGKKDYYLEHLDDCWKITYVIDIGKPVLIRNIDISIENNVDDSSVLETALDNPLINAGDMLRHDDYEKLKQKIIVIAKSQGYLDARYEKSELAIYPKDYSADVILKLNIGHQYHFGDIQFEQTDVILDDDYIGRLLNVNALTVYSQEQLAKIRKTLSSTGYFSSIEFLTEKNPVDQTVLVRIQLTPAIKYEYTVGVGVSTDVGLRIRGGYANYRVNGRGDSYQLDGLFSGVNQELTLNYKRRLFSNPLKKTWNYSIGYKNEKIDAGKSATFSMSAAHTFKRDYWYTTTSLTALYEDFEEQFVNNSTNLLIPSYSWSYSKSDQPFYTMKGTRSTVLVKGAAENILSDVSFLSLYAEIKWIRSIGEKSRVLLRGGMGAIASSDLDQLPLSLKYFSGGDNSIRGYSYKSIGPKNDQGKIIGGKYLAYASAEYEYQFKPDWGGAIFIDAGDAFSKQFDLHRGVGLGVRWYSPIGPVRFDIAHPLDNSEDHFQLHFSLGQDI